MASTPNASRIEHAVLRRCCAANVVTSGVAREPDVYRDCSNRLLRVVPSGGSFSCPWSPIRTAFATLRAELRASTDLRELLLGGLIGRKERFNGQLLESKIDRRTNRRKDAEEP